MVAYNSESFVDAISRSDDGDGMTRRRTFRRTTRCSPLRINSCDKSKNDMNNAPPRKPKRTHVMFALDHEDDIIEELNNSVRTPSPLDMEGASPPTSMADLWYTAEEYKAMNDSLTTKERQQRMYVSTVRTNFVNCILELQDEQRLYMNYNLIDPKGLAIHSKTCSKLAKKDAIARAEDIAKQVLSFSSSSMNETSEDEAPGAFTNKQSSVSCTRSNAQSTKSSLCKDIIDSVLDIVSDDELFGSLGLDDDYIDVKYCYRGNDDDDDGDGDDCASTTSSVTLPTQLLALPTTTSCDYEKEERSSVRLISS